MGEANASNMSLVNELRKLKALIEETASSLQSQRDILKQRGMSLPPEVMQSVNDLNKSLETLEQSIFSDQTELGQLRFLTQTSAMINSSLDLDDVLTRSMDVVTDLTNAERGYLILRNPETNNYEFRVTRESDLAPQQGSSDDPQISYTILREVLQTGEPLLADNAYKDDRLQSGMSIAQLALRSVLCVPLLYKDEVVGVVYVDNRLRAGVFTEREKTLLTAFANQASVAIENARLFERIQQSLAEIKQMKELMDNVFASIGSGVITTDAQHNILLFNQAAASILSRSETETIGQKLSSVIPGVSADLDAHLAKVRGQEASQDLEAELQVPRRGRIALSMKLTPLKDAEAQTQGVAMVMDDLTEQRKSEETLSLMRRYLPPEMVDNIHTISRLALGGERREVTCMFVNVRPVDTFPEDLRPKQVMEQLNRYLAKATDSVHHYKGIIDKYMGNIVMALFNTQLNPMDDHPRRAVEAALAIREAFVAFYAEMGLNPDPHYYHIGIHSGDATLGNVGSLNRREFSAIGDTINLSKRLEQNAAPGSIIVSEDVVNRIIAQDGALPQTMQFWERQPIQVKGRQQKTRIYEVTKA